MNLSDRDNYMFVEFMPHGKRTMIVPEEGGLTPICADLSEALRASANWKEHLLKVIEAKERSRRRR